MTTFSMQLIDVKKITKRTINIRTIKSPEEQEKLRASIASVGLLEPPVISPYKGQNGSTEYELHAGNRRLDAVLALDWKTIPAMVADGPVSLNDAKDINAIENLIRAEVHPADVARRIASELAEGGVGESAAGPRSKEGQERSARARLIGERYGISPKMVNHYVRIAKCGAYAKYANDASKGDWTPSVMAMIAIAGRGKEAEAAYDQLVARHHEAITEAKGGDGGGTGESGEAGEGKEKAKGPKLQSKALIVDEFKFFRKLEKSIEKGEDNPATGKSFTKTETERVSIILDVMAWTTKAKKGLLPPSSEFMPEPEPEAEETTEE